MSSQNITISLLSQTTMLSLVVEEAAYEQAKMEGMYVPVAGVANRELAEAAAQEAGEKLIAIEGVVQQGVSQMTQLKELAQIAAQNAVQAESNMAMDIEQASEEMLAMKIASQTSAVSAEASEDASLQHLQELQTLAGELKVNNFLNALIF